MPRNPLPPLSRRWLIVVALGTVTSYLVVTFVGSILTLLLYPAVQGMLQSPNATVPFMAFIVNGSTVAIALWFLVLASARAEAPSSSSLDALLARNAEVLSVASFVTVVAFLQVVIGLLTHSFRTFLLLPFSHATQADIFSTTATVALGIALPAILLAALLTLSARWQASRG